MRRVLFAVLTALATVAVTAAPAAAHGGRNARELAEQGRELSQAQFQEMVEQGRAQLEAHWRETGAHDRPAATAQPASAALAAPAADAPQTTTWNGNLTYAPDSIVFTPLNGADPCDAPECEEFTLTVPEGAGALYVKTTWEREDYGVHLYGFSPSGEQFGLDWADRDTEYDKQTGNVTTLPMAEFTVDRPEPGDWRIRVRAAWGIEFDYAALATVTDERAVAYPREDPVQLARWATQQLDVNIVLAGTTLTPEQIEQVREHLPDQYRTSVFTHQFASGGPGDSETEQVNNCAPLVNWARCHFGGTYSEEERADGGSVPYFEPVKFEYEYHFIEASEVYTRAAFAKIAELTEAGQYHGDNQTAYLQTYNATQGKFRSPDKQVVDTTSVDMIDALAFEDWLFETRYDHCDFRDLETGETLSGGFITPAEDAYYDPYYDKFGKNLDHMPQGRGQSLSVFFFDTYSPEYASEYFNPNRYHNFSTMDNFIDPDTGTWDGIDYGRLWGGRYRFVFFDLAAAPNFQESTAWPNGTAGGSADPPNGDPPIWEYLNNPYFEGEFEERALARNVYMMLFSRMTAGYLYRPKPHDIYQLTTVNFSDYYSHPPTGVWWTDLEKFYSEPTAAHWLSSAIPAATFRSGLEIEGFEPYRYPGCSDEHVGSKSNVTFTVVMLPDPSCVGQEPDPLQQTLEVAKAQGDDVYGLGIPFSQAVSASVVRNYWERNRNEYAPMGEGVYSFVLVNGVFEKSYTWSLPAIVGGIAFPTPHGENWGQLQNRNDRARSIIYTDCSKSAPAAPGCNGIPPIPAHQGGYGVTYTVGHEASHGLGLLHPHDFAGVDKGPDGEWDYYWSTLTWMPDSTHSPTTYFGSIYPYGVWDQDNIMRGHVAEYIRMAQDAIADAYFEAGRKGIDDVSEAPAVMARQRLMTRYLREGKALFADGDYLHAEFAFKNAYLAATGVRGPEVAPRFLQPGEKVLFRAKPQRGPTWEEAVRSCGPDGGTTGTSGTTGTTGTDGGVLPTGGTTGTDTGSTGATGTGDATSSGGPTPATGAAGGLPLAFGFLLGALLLLPARRRGWRGQMR